MILFNPKLNLRFFPFSALYTIKPTSIKKINSIKKNIYSFIYICLREFSSYMYMGVNPSNRRLRSAKQVKITRDPQKLWSVSRITNSSILGYNGIAISFDKNTMVYQTVNNDNNTNPENIIAKGFLTNIFNSAIDKKMYFISEKDQVFSIKKNIFLKNYNAATEIPSHYVEFDIKMNGTQIEAEQILPTPTATNKIDLEIGDIYEIIHPGIDISGNTLLWSNIDAQNSPNKIYIKGTRFTLNQDLNNLSISILTNTNVSITTPAKIFRIQNPGQNIWNAETLLFHSSLTKVGSRKGSGFGIGNQGGNSLFSFKLNNRIKPHNNWNPLQLNNPNFNSKLYQKNDNHTSFPYSKFCNYRRRHFLPRFFRLNSDGTSKITPTSRNKLSKGKNRY